MGTKLYVPKYDNKNVGWYFDKYNDLMSQ